ncbi:MAG: hypothetical protein JXL84_15975 [Deltaproteobacteria bacterium]|nr:hypothetical protein [Deltaproteobacteria bacterium]
MILSESVKYIKGTIPEAEITLLLRPGLEEAAKWIGGVKGIVAIEEWGRNQTRDTLWGLAYPTPRAIERALKERGKARDFDLILPYPLGKWWFRNTSQLRPCLKWQPEEARFGQQYIRHLFPEHEKYVIAINSSTGTSDYYPYNKNWGSWNFQSLISQTLSHIPEAKIILVDEEPAGRYPMESRIYDARGKHSVSESISIIANSDLFVCLDTGPANLVYFLEGISLHIIALLGQSHSFFRHGNPPASSDVLLKKVCGTDERIENISVETVMRGILDFYRLKTQK